MWKLNKEIRIEENGKRSYEEQLVELIKDKADIDVPESKINPLILEDLCGKLGLRKEQQEIYIKSDLKKFMEEKITEVNKGSKITDFEDLERIINKRNNSIIFLTSKYRGLAKKVIEMPMKIKKEIDNSCKGYGNTLNYANLSKSERPHYEGIIEGHKICLKIIMDYFERNLKEVWELTNNTLKEIAEDINPLKFMGEKNKGNFYSLMEKVFKRMVEAEVISPEQKIKFMKFITRDLYTT